jgi:hypothetical protein
MISIVEECHRMNSSDRATFRRWLILNTVIGALVVMLIAMIAINGMFWGGELKSANSAKNNDASHQVEER